MQLVNRTCIVVIATLFVSPLLAQKKNLTEQQVLATDDRRYDALRRNDPAPLESIYADDYTLVTATGQVKTKADQIRQLKSGELRYGKIEVVERSVRMYGDVAVVLSVQDDVIIQGGRQIIAGKERVTRIYKYMHWRLACDRDPCDPCPRCRWYIEVKLTRVRAHNLLTADPGDAAPSCHMYEKALLKAKRLVSAEGNRSHKET